MKNINFILFLTVFVTFSCKSPDNDIASQNVDEAVNTSTITLTKAQFENSGMEWGSIVEKSFPQTVHTNGIIDVPPQSLAVISAFSGGYVKNTHLLIGDVVKKGQRLVTLENPEFITMQQAYLETAEQLSYLKSEYERQKTMFEENITSQKSFLKAESDYNTSLGRNNSLIKNLQMLNIDPASVSGGNIVSQVGIYSPIDGHVTQIFVNTGTYVSPSDKIMEIMNTDHIHLELKVFEKDLLQVKKDQEILFTVPEASGQVFNGDIHLVGTSIDPNGRVAMVHGHIDHTEENHFAAGMFVEAEIVTGTTDHFALPDDAVVEMDGKHFVLMLDREVDNTYEMHAIIVKAERSYDGYTSIENSSEFEKDSRFLVKGGFVLLEE